MIEIGMLARSKAGHDKGQVFVIIAIEEDYVFLADGKNRSVCRPKRKKIKHIQMIHRSCDAEPVDDVAIRKVIQDYIK